MTKFRMGGYRKLEAQVRGGELDALMARWEFGARLLDERRASGGKQLPQGRLDQLCEALNLSGAEIHNRMQFAEEYQKQEVANALAQYHSWHEIVRQHLGRRQPKMKPPKWTNEADRLVFDMSNCPPILVSLREVIGDVTPAMMDAAREYNDCWRDKWDALEAAWAAKIEAERQARAA